MNGFKHYRRALLGKLLPHILIGVCTLFASENLAWAQEEGECYAGEYVLTVSSVRSLRDRAIESFDEAVAGGVDLADESSRAVLLQTAADDGIANQGETISADTADKTCERLRRLQREARKDGEGTIIRNVTCSCNAKVDAVVSPNDNFYPNEWGLHQDNDIDMDAPEAWNMSIGSPSVVIAVIDSGVDYTHPDLRDNMWVNSGEIPGNGLDDDANGYVDDVHGLNAITSSGNPADDNGHGTHCAGTIAGRGNNGFGVTGVGWNMKIMAVKFLGSNGSGSLYDSIRAIDYVTMMKTRGVNVVASNNSWGYAGGSWSPLRDAILRMQNAGVLFVAAAGNSTNNNDASPFSPANTDLENVISVAAVDSSGNLASFSNYGANTVHVGAPGVSIASTYPGNQYYYMSGTSMAAPHVSGLLGLAASYSNSTDWRLLKSKLYSSVVPLGSLSGKVKTSGMINALKMLQAVPVGPTPTPTNTPVPTLTPTPTRTPLPPTPTPTIAPGYHAVRGTVRVSGVPYAGVKVTLTAAGQSFERITGADGTYQFAAILGPVNYTVKAISPAAAYFEPQSGFLIGSAVHDFSATMQKPTVAIKVVNSMNQPVQGVQVDAGEYGVYTTDITGTAWFLVPYGASYKLRALGNGNYLFNNPERSGIAYGSVGRVFVAEQ